MIKRELAKDPKLANESWDRFLPKFRRRHLKSSEKTARKHERLEAKNAERAAAGLEPIKAIKPEKKVYTPFPPAQLPRKVRSFMAASNEQNMCLSIRHRSTCNWSPENTSSNLQRRNVGRSARGNKRHARYPDLPAVLTLTVCTAKGDDCKAPRRARGGIRCTC